MGSSNRDRQTRNLRHCLSKVRSRALLGALADTDIVRKTTKVTNEETAVVKGLRSHEVFSLV